VHPIWATADAHTWEPRHDIGLHGHRVFCRPRHAHCAVDGLHSGLKARTRPQQNRPALLKRWLALSQIKGDNVTDDRRGNSRAYILARLDRDGLVGGEGLCAPFGSPSSVQLALLLGGLVTLTRPAFALTLIGSSRC
jgi:hypothetical protein